MRFPGITRAKCARCADELLFRWPEGNSMASTEENASTGTNTVILFIFIIIYKSAHADSSCGSHHSLCFAHAAEDTMLLSRMMMCFLRLKRRVMDDTHRRRWRMGGKFSAVCWEVLKQLLRQVVLPNVWLQCSEMSSCQ